MADGSTLGIPGNGMDFRLAWTLTCTGADGVKHTATAVTDGLGVTAFAVTVPASLPLRFGFHSQPVG